MTCLCLPESPALPCVWSAWLQVLFFTFLSVPDFAPLDLIFPFTQTSVFTLAVTRKETDNDGKGKDERNGEECRG